MNTVRGFIFYIVLAITVIPVCFIVLILTPFTRAETRYGVMRAWGRFVIAALRVICGVRVQVKGMENCPKGPVVVLSKHQSAWETFWLGAYLPYPGAYVYKESLNGLPSPFPLNGLLPLTAATAAALSALWSQKAPPSLSGVGGSFSSRKAPACPLVSM